MEETDDKHVAVMCGMNQSPQMMLSLFQSEVSQEYLRILSEEPYLIEAVKCYDDLRDWGKSKAEREANIVDIRREPKIGRNEICPCGSGKKYKHCCIHKIKEDE